MAVGVLALCVLLGGDGARSSNERGADWVDLQVKARALPERGFGPDGVAWAESLPRALELAKAHHRLVYLLIDRGDVARGRA